MAKLVYTPTRGSDDPTRVAFPFILANGAVEFGHEAAIFLASECVCLMKQATGWRGLPRAACNRTLKGLLGRPCGVRA